MAPDANGLLVAAFAANGLAPAAEAKGFAAPESPVAAAAAGGLNYAGAYVALNPLGGNCWLAPPHGVCCYY